MYVLSDCNEELEYNNPENLNIKYQTPLLQ